MKLYVQQLSFERRERFVYDSGRVTDPSLVVISLASRRSWDKKIRMVRKTTMYVVICTTVVAITVHVGAEVRDRDTQNVKIAGEAWHWPNASCAVWVIFLSSII